MKKQALAHLSYNSTTNFLNVIFYHPVLKDNKHPHRKRRVRKALGTTDVKEATSIINDLNELIQNKEWHKTYKRYEAELKYGKLVSSIFYDNMEEVSETVIQDAFTRIAALDDVDKQLQAIVLSMLDKLKQTVNK